MNFCSRVSLASHEQMAGTGVRGEAYVFLPTPKRLWHEQEMNSHWASAAELQAIRLARKSGVVTRLYNPPTGEDAQPPPMLVYARGGAESEALQRLLAQFAGRWPIDAEGRPRVAICVHGTRDRCCAKFGFAAFRTARQLYESNASVFEPIECSHLGGDRFAATGVFFPSGSMYAHLDLDIAAICAAEGQGRLSPSNYRGRVFDPPPVQLARTALAREGLMDDAAAPIAVTGRDPLQLDADVGGRRYRIRLKLAQAEFFGSCAAMAAGRPSRAKRAVIESVEPLGG